MTPPANPTYAIVPVDPTDEMQSAGLRAASAHWACAWSAQIAAAPPLPNNLIEHMARAIADQIGRGFDSVHRDKAHWCAAVGILNDTYLDINEPRQDDYVDAARAALTALQTYTGNTDKGEIA